MKNETIYLVKITQSTDYEPDTTLEMEAFTYMSDAQMFLASHNFEMDRSCCHWHKKDNPWDFEASITELTVK
jgi:hypothetical protein